MKTPQQARLLIVGDPLEKLQFTTDSSLALAEGALALGFVVHWATLTNLDLLNGTLVVQNPIEIRMVGHSLQTSDLACPVDKSLPVASYRKILIRKDPPFDESYVDLCWFMSQIAPDKVVNSVDALLLHHEKLTPWTLTKSGALPLHSVVPTLVSKRIQSLLTFAHEQFDTARSLLNALSSDPKFASFQFKLIAKPWRGHGGREIHSFCEPQEIEKWLSEMRVEGHSEELKTAWILQPFLPEIFTEGDRRVFIINGEVVFDFVRFPAAGKIEANLAQGGHAQLLPMSANLLQLSQRIGLELMKLGISIAGLDFIGERLMEVNVTSPTGIRTYEALTGNKISADLFAKILGTDK